MEIFHILLTFLSISNTVYVNGYRDLQECIFMKRREWIKRIRELTRSSTFMRMLLSYLVVILVSVVVYCSMYSYAFNNMRSYVLSFGSSAQKDAVNQIENLLSGADAALNQLSSDIQIQRFQNSKDPFVSDDYMSMYNIKNTLQNYKELNPNIYNMLIYFRNSKSICSCRTASARLDLAYNTEFGYEDTSLDEWLDIVSTDSPLSILPAKRLANQKSAVITYVHRFPCNYIGKNASLAIVQYETSLLNSILQTGLLTKSSNSFLVDRSGNIVFHCNEIPENDSSFPYLLSTHEECSETKINGTNAIVFRTEIPKYGLTCITSFDMNTLMAETTHHKMILLGVLLGALAVELVYVLLISRRTYQPIQDVLRLLPEKPGKGESELASIHASITRMNRESEEIRRQLDDQQEIIRKLCLSKLLGLEPGLDNIDLTLSKLPADCRVHFVFIIYTSSRDTIDKGISFGRACVSKLRQEMIRKQIADNVISFDYFTNSTAFILSIMNEDRINDSISELTELLFACDFEFSAGIGLPAMDLNQISRSFSEARLAAQEAKSTGSRVVLYEDTQSRQSAYDYSSDVEAALEQNIISGNCEKAIGIINNVYWKTRESLSAPAKLQLLLNEIYGTLLKIRQHNHLESPSAEREFYFLLNEIEFNTNLFQRYNSILQAVRYYCDQVVEEKNSVLPSLCQRVSTYIADQYADPDLCLDSIAERFEVSPKYLSRHFKEQTGSNISTFITNIRLKQAGYLLQDKDINIAQLAKMCGYANANTFHKAFKRYWGMSPGSFRDENILSHTENKVNVQNMTDFEEIEGKEEGKFEITN